MTEVVAHGGSLELSPTELKVLRGLAEGMTERKHAVHLGLGYETLRSRRKHLYDRLGARNAAHAVAIGYRLGLLP